jgi:hypothetical protein
MSRTPTEISPATAKAEYGIVTLHEIMPNGERRFRLIDRRGLGYVRTNAGPTGAWQSSHFHHYLQETYIVQDGWIAVAQLTANNELDIHILKPGQTWTSQVELPHNIYMFANSTTHVVKHGTGAENDWQTSDVTVQLDALIAPLSEEDIIRLAQA